MSLRQTLLNLAAEIQPTGHKRADDLLTESDWNKLQDNFEKIKEALTAIATNPTTSLPKNFIYIRLPGSPLPYGESGAFNWTQQHEWETLHTKWPGTFLRLAGGNASVFKADSEQVSYDTKALDGNEKPNKGGGQIDSLQNHTHTVTTQWQAGNGLAWGKHNIAGHNTITSTTSAPDARSDIETRPKNITVEMYRYIGQ